MAPGESAMDPHGPNLASEIDIGPQGSDTTTPLPTPAGHAGLRVRVRPEYLPARSDPHQPMHVFAYHVTLDYEASVDAPRVQVVDRHWRIIDASGGEDTVDGEGVVGLQPILVPGERFEYASYCPLRSRWGTMEGHYGVVTLDEHDRPTARHEAAIGRFYLVSS
ncbi:MAG: Co2+/Mg2+ efflux protein ApaG [Phycisphaeraceae bacterium]|nr:Co2+/Mg2+ efflux protein ApaG [Phycisphaeraceae bacterium]